MAMARNRTDRIFGTPRNATQRLIDEQAERDDEFLVQRTSAPPSQTRQTTDIASMQQTTDRSTGRFGPSDPTSA